MLEMSHHKSILIYSQDYLSVSAMCLFVLAGDGSEDSRVELKKDAGDVLDDCPPREVQDPVASTDGIIEDLNVSELTMPKCRRDGHFNFCQVFRPESQKTRQ